MLVGPDVACATHVLGDRQRLKQVLLNLLSNAVKYNREGGSVHLACEPVDGGRLRIKVTDTGLGIPPESVERLFVPFERVGSEHSAIEGTGLGLPLSKRLAEAMGGTLDLASTPQQGSTFWVELSLVEGPVQQDERERPDEPAPVSQEPEPAGPTLTWSCWTCTCPTCPGRRSCAVGQAGGSRPSQVVTQASLPSGSARTQKAGASAS